MFQTQSNTLLAGKRVFPDSRDNAVIKIELETWDYVDLHFCCLNLLTPESAFHFIHLLSHLNGAFFTQVAITAQPQMTGLNPRILQLFSNSNRPLTFHARRFNAYFANPITSLFVEGMQFVHARSVTILRTFDAVWNESMLPEFVGSDGDFIIQQVL